LQIDLFAARANSKKVLNGQLLEPAEITLPFEVDFQEVGNETGERLLLLCFSVADVFVILVTCERI
jgi:hypothetical protein